MAVLKSLSYELQHCDSHT